MNNTLKACLERVQKPSRYVGGEYGSVHKDAQDVGLRYAFCFPDLYEIGMSHLGSKIMYGLLNDIPGVWCQRVFAPAADMEAEMRARNLPLFGLESSEAITDFDILGFTLQYEMNYTAVLNMLDLAGVPLWSRERDSLSPLVMAGGPCVYNLEPVAEFFDLIVVGEGEAVTPELIALYRQAREAGWDKKHFLREAAGIQGVYVPELYDVAYHDDGTVAAITPKEGAPAVVHKAVVQDFDAAYFPLKPIVPSTEVVFDRAMVELFRGCRRGCRFCQAGYTYRPIRAKKPETLAAQARALVENTGWDEVSLTSLSSSDYPGLEGLCNSLVDDFEAMHVSLALPSLRADNFNIGLMESVQKVRKSGLTFAPEAGSQRLRDIINKNLREEDLLEACRVAFSAGWSNVKLYFMMGLPGETDEDLQGISAIARKVLGVFREYGLNKARGCRVSVGVSVFVPKAQTPFQWVGQTERSEVARRQQLLMDSLKIKNVTFSLHNFEVSFVEAVLARGDRRLSAVLHRVWQLGARLDGWDEHFSPDRWRQAFEDCGIDPAFYANRSTDESEVMPWEHIFSGVRKGYMWNEYQAALRGEATPDCKAGCRDCGALELFGGRCDV